MNAKAITAFKNESASTPSFTWLKATIHEVKGRLRTHITTIGNDINSHTLEKHDATAAQQLYYHNHLIHQLKQLTLALQVFNDHIKGIFSALKPGPANGPAAPPPPTATHNLHD